MMIHSAVILSVLLGVAAAHMCLLNPTQRGSISGINKAGAVNCILLKGPCGGRKGTEPTVQLVGGKNHTVIMQKNLSHYNSGNPGNFTVSIGMSGGSKFMLLATVPDNNDPSLSLYSVSVNIPDMKGHMVIQTLYNTHNAKAPPVFHQCSDVNVV